MFYSRTGETALALSPRTGCQHKAVCVSTRRVNKQTFRGLNVRFRVTGILLFAEPRLVR